jgi:hypothetical protein
MATSVAGKKNATKQVEPVGLHRHLMGVGRLFFGFLATANSGRADVVESNSAVRSMSACLVGS